ncbi:MAG: hypothetical protein ACREF1_16850, partial [Acetobacteraceae bacterium]
IPFHEYFHGDNGRGLGASHQTGWTGLVALLLQPRVETLGCALAVAHTHEDAVRAPAGRPDDLAGENTLLNAYDL